MFSVSTRWILVVLEFKRKFVYETFTCEKSSKTEWRFGKHLKEGNVNREPICKWFSWDSL